ncbi:hypothetical protein A6F68_00307 [Tsuneonella dongtanensis]|uniref:Uncharacterized protein n=1 Tax=Tsuneonella dongtanensis TaxID=692370 RepID=A0A1B2A9N0_9SPHN|nr:hypothetical protein [Tsuneonella dongtanensis]ANY18842.1 hypothetical protein A6F68_00307 [Tsuneonella dongtanensis]
MKYRTMAALALAALPVAAQADSFMPPTLTEARSPSGEWIATVIPARLSCAQGEIRCAPAARAVIEYVGKGTDRMASTTVRLVNPEAPGRTLLTDDGERLLTVDDYASMGFGPNALVIYRRDGSVVRRLALADMVPADYIDGLPRTASSLLWIAEAPRIEPDSHRAIVPLLLIGPMGQEYRGRRSLALALDLDTGEIEQPAGPEWERARNCARANSWIVPDRHAMRERERFRKLCR